MELYLDDSTKIINSFLERKERVGAEMVQGPFANDIMELSIYKMGDNGKYAIFGERHSEEPTPAAIDDKHSNHLYLNNDLPSVDFAVMIVSSLMEIQ